MAKNPQRFSTRNEPQPPPIGGPPNWLTEEQAAAWAAFVRELPWLTQADRALLEIASTIRGRLMAGEEVGLNALNLLRQCLGAMGATPASRSTVSMPDKAENDPAEAYFT